MCRARRARGVRRHPRLVAMIASGDPLTLNVSGASKAWLKG